MSANSGWVEVYSASSVEYDGRVEGGSAAWNGRLSRDFFYDRNTFASSQAAIDCCWYHAIRDSEVFFGYDGSCPPLAELDNSFSGASASGWKYSYTHGVGGSLSGVHRWDVYVCGASLDLSGLYKSAAQWDEEFVPPAGGGAYYNFDADTLRIKELTVTVDTYNMYTWTGPTDLTQELWETPVPPGQQTGWGVSDYAEPSSFQGTYRTTLSGESTYQWSPDPSQYSDPYNIWNSIYGGYHPLNLSFIPPVVYGGAPNAGVPDSSDLINYEEIHWAPAVVITIDAVVEVYATWWDVEVYPGASDEWSAILTAAAPPNVGNWPSQEIITVSPTEIVDRFPIGSDGYGRMTLYNPTYGLAMVANDDAVYKVQLSRNGTTLLNTASASTQYSVGRAKRLAGLFDYGSTIVGVNDSYLMVFDSDLNELDYIDLSGLGTGGSFVPGFTGEIIDLAGYDGIGSQVFTVAGDGSTTLLTDFFPASYDPYWIYETRAWAFDEWGVGYVTTLFEVYDDATGDDRLYIQLRAFDRNYNLLPGTSIIDSQYLAGRFPARVMRGRNGPVLVVAQETNHSTEEGYDPSDINRVSMYPLSGGSAIISETVGYSENLPTGYVYPFIPLHSGYGGGYAHLWGSANGSEGFVWNIATADINNAGGNTVLYAQDTGSLVGFPQLNAICSLGQFYPEQTIDGGLEDQRRRFWRPRPAW